MAITGFTYTFTETGSLIGLAAWAWALAGRGAMLSVQSLRTKWTAMRNGFKREPAVPG